MIPKTNLSVSLYAAKIFYVRHFRHKKQIKLFDAAGTHNVYL